MRTTSRIIVGFAVLVVGVAVGPAAGASAASLAPVVSTGQAEGVAQNSATLTATVETEGSETTFEFDLGADTTYGSRIFADAGYEQGPQTFRVSLQGLAPGTTYHYRVVATNAFGAVYGVDETFTTGTYPSSALSAPVTLPFVPATLLVPEPSPSATAKASATGSPSDTAKAGATGSASAASAGVQPAADTARQDGSARGEHSGGKSPRARKRKDGRRGAGHVHSANRGGGRR